jgi:hypothetical protein
LLPKHAKRTVRSYSSADQGSRTSEPVDNTARLSRMASSSSSSSSSSSAAATTTALAASLAEPLEATAPSVQRTATGYLNIRQGKEPLLYPSRAHFVTIYHAELLKAHEKIASLQNELARKHECERVMDAYNCPLSMAEAKRRICQK